MRVCHVHLLVLSVLLFFAFTTHCMVAAMTPAATLEEFAIHKMLSSDVPHPRPKKFASNYQAYSRYTGNRETVHHCIVIIYA